MRGEIAALALEVVRKVMASCPPMACWSRLAETAARDMLPTQTMS